MTPAEAKAARAVAKLQPMVERGEEVAHAMRRHADALCILLEETHGESARFRIDADVGMILIRLN